MKRTQLANQRSGARAAVIMLLALATLAGRAAAPSDPAAPVREAYRLEKVYLAEDDAISRALRLHEVAPPRKAKLPWQAPHRDKLFSKRFASLWDTDERYSKASGGVGNIDVDVFLAAQDFDDNVLHDLAVDVVKQQGDHAEVRARFTNMSPTDVRFDVVLEDGRWVIDDIREGGSSIAEALAQPYFCAEGWTGPCNKGP